MTSAPLHLFQGFGIELEYMIVDRETLAVRPLSDELLKAATGAYLSDHERDAAAWSNELVLHVIEFKTNGPAPALAPLPRLFAEQVSEVHRLLEPMGAFLMPGAMHPWMDPFTETRLWLHDYSAVYAAYDRIFGCQGHGWSNLQSMHVNLPFHGDDEFGRLHAAIRLALPLLPALAASSPIMDGRITGIADNRLEVYRTNSARIPSMTGSVIPEPVYDRAAYERDILERIYRDLEPHDPEGVLRYEFANARGAIARFDRDAIEIRILDAQESPLADLAVAALTVALVKAFVEERWTSYEWQRNWSVEALNALYQRCVRQGHAADIDDHRYLEALGWTGARGPCAGEVWRYLASELAIDDPALGTAAKRLVEAGTLASRIIRALNGKNERDAMRRVYRELCSCLHDNRLFLPAA